MFDIFVGASFDYCGVKFNLKTIYELVKNIFTGFRIILRQKGFVFISLLGYSREVIFENFVILRLT